MAPDGGSGATPGIVNVTVRVADTVSRAWVPKSSGSGEPMARRPMALTASRTLSPLHQPSATYALTEATRPLTATALRPSLQDATSVAPPATVGAVFSDEFSSSTPAISGWSVAWSPSVTGEFGLGPPTNGA